MLYHMTKLFARLCSYGIRGTLLTWIRNFLSQRTYQTRVDLSLSDVAHLVSGVVQGSGIGPLMFLIYLNELIGIQSFPGWFFFLGKTFPGWSFSRMTGRDVSRKDFVNGRPNV